MIVGRVVQADWHGPALTGALLIAIVVLYAATGAKGGTSREAHA